MHCGFLFRSPLLSDDTYDMLYREGGLDVWDVEAHREDFRLIREMLDPLDGQKLKVLDFGCYTGQLLVSLPKSFLKFGVEPNRQAAAIAADRGIRVMAANMDNSDACEDGFDVILCCDVIEHVANPLKLIQRFRSQLKRDGLLIISTGNSDTSLWRLTGSRFWYCQFPEHISFVGTRWLHRIQWQTGFEIQCVTRFNYRGGRVDLSRVIAALLYWISPPIYGALCSALGKRNHAIAVPGNGATMDHILCRLRAI